MTVPEAVEIARKHLIEVMPDLASSTLELDEVDTPPYSTAWSFTFTAISPIHSMNTDLHDLLRSRRSTKSVEVDSESGSLLAIRNQALERMERIKRQENIRKLRGKIQFEDEVDGLRDGRTFDQAATNGQ